MKILPRSAWTTTKAKGSAFNVGRSKGIVCHYPAAGKDIGVLTQSHEARRIRGWRDYHVRGRGWADLGYNYIVTQAGRVYEGRGMRVGAHTAGHNSSTLGILFMVGDNEDLTPDAIKAGSELIAWLRNKGVGKGLWGHQQMSGASTRCPGPFIMKRIRNGDLAAGRGGSTSTTPAKRYGNPDATHPVGSRTMGLYDAGSDVAWLQQRLGVTVDRYFGPDVDAAVRAFQRANGLTVDGLVGPKTLAALRDDKAPVKVAPAPKGDVPGPGHDFPLPKGHYFGPRSGPDRSVSGFHGRRFKGVKDSSWLIRFVEQLARRGWNVNTSRKPDDDASYLAQYGNDGKYGNELRDLIRAFQSEQGLPADGLIGKQTWDEAFKKPVK
ncbi:peptidoglycan hydrolase-like protein with peptidoglycan-binding domain [Brevibacterium pityocampae]